MGDHDAPERWLDRWRAQEPVRLYLWSVAAAVLAGCVVAGWLTQELALAIAGPIAAALMVGGTAAARGQAYAPATVQRLQSDWIERTNRLQQNWEAETAEQMAEGMEQQLEDQHQASWQLGWQDGWDAGVEAAVAGVGQVTRTPEQVAEEARAQPATDRGSPPPTQALAAQAPCPYVEHDARGVLLECVLPVHPERYPHELEAAETEE